MLISNGYSTLIARFISSVLLLLAVGLAPNNVLAQTAGLTGFRWQRITAGETVSIWVDSRTARFDETPGVLRVWTEWRYVRTQQKEGTRFDTMAMQLDVDCNSRNFKSLQGQFRLGDESVSTFETPSYQQEWIDPIPGTLGENVVDGVCFWAGFDA